MRLSVSLTTGLALLALALPATANDESPGKAIKRVAKTMSKLKSYNVSTSVEGGMAQDAEHKLTSVSVREQYNCDVVGGLARINGSKEAFRLRTGAEGKGTIKDGGVWKGILATPEGRQMERLFQRPETHFATLNKYRKLAKWLPADPKDAKATVNFGDDAAADAPVKETRVRKGKKSKKRNKADGPVSHRLRLVAPTTEAINAFTTIVNSGCLSGG